jgi:hypothetical protein
MAMSDPLGCRPVKRAIVLSPRTLNRRAAICEEWAR